MEAERGCQRVMDGGRERLSEGDGWRLREAVKEGWMEVGRGCHRWMEETDQRKRIIRDIVQ